MGKRGNGEGSVYQRSDGMWIASLVLVDGKRKTFSSKRRQVVARKLAEALRDREKGLTIITDERLTVGAYLAQWLDRMTPPRRVRPSTHRQYTHSLAHIISAYGDLRLTRLTAAHLTTLYARLQRPEPPADGGKTTRPLSATTVHLAHTVLRKALGDAVKLDLIPANVTDRVDAPKARRPPIEPLTPEETQRFLEAVQGERLEALYILAIATGMRIGELLGLTWRHVDLEAGRLSVVATLQRAPGPGKTGADRWELAKPKTKSSQRSIRLSPLAVDALRAHRKRQLAERLAVADVWADRDLVFCDELGDFLNAITIERYPYQRALARAGIPHKRFHDLRHTAATSYLAQGHSLKAVSAMLGHSSIAITGDIYAHVTGAMEDALTATMDAILSRNGVSR